MPDKDNNSGITIKFDKDGNITSFRKEYYSNNKTITEYTRNADGTYTKSDGSKLLGEGADQQKEKDFKDNLENALKKELAKGFANMQGGRLSAAIDQLNLIKEAMPETDLLKYRVAEMKKLYRGEAKFSKEFEEIIKKDEISADDKKILGKEIDIMLEAAQGKSANLDKATAGKREQIEKLLKVSTIKAPDALTAIQKELDDAVVNNVNLKVQNITIITTDAQGKETKKIYGEKINDKPIENPDGTLKEGKKEIKSLIDKAKLHASRSESIEAVSSFAHIEQNKLGIKSVGEFATTQSQSYSGRT